MEDIHNPVEDYKSNLKETHAKNTADFFESLLRQSVVDEAANVQTVKSLRALEKKAVKENALNRNWKMLRGTVFASIVISVCIVLLAYSYWWITGVAIIFAPAIYKLNQIIASVQARIAAIEKQIDSKRSEAWQQMSALNQLYDWDITAKLIQQTAPRIALDPYFTNGRLSELQDTFGLNDEFNHDQRSIIFSHSGVLNGNPFVIAKMLEHWIGEKTYHGSLQISWTESVTDSRGNRSTVTRHQTLNASVTKPFPDYGNRTFIVYGNEAAPDLSFRRTSSNLSKLESGLINNWRKKRAEKALTKKSRDLTNDFTIMSNREFDTLFNATDRDHEVQFRLLFTPLAQQEMLSLLKDKQLGYGDNFEFSKQFMINVIESEHMKTVDISGNPEMFHAYELAQARKTFNEYHNHLFKSLFFGIAPILTIPLYQQHRPHAEIYKNTYASKSCFWEHETIANYFGEQTFQHPDCVTNNILKTKSKIEADGTQTVNVIANCYRSENRTDYVSIRGGDGHYHDVPVNWVEFFNVQRASDMVVKENLAVKEEAAALNEDVGWETLFQNKGIDTKNVVLRRSILSALLSSY